MIGAVVSAAVFIGRAKPAQRADGWKHQNLPGRLSPGPFEERLWEVRAVLAHHASPRLRIVQHSECTGLAELLRAYDAVKALGGEGVMLREPRSMYV